MGGVAQIGGANMRYVTIFVLVALCLALAPAPALAVSGYDSSYASESAFVMINPGETQAFQVVFVNTGTLTWVKGAATQVDLAACLEDKVTCNAQDASESGWNSGWLSSTRYATTTQLTVAPAGFATFAYNIRAPQNAIGTHRFNGDLVVASSGARIHPEGYYQEATLNAVGSTGPAPAPPPILPAVQTAELSITKTDAPDPVQPGGNIMYTLTATNNSGFDAVNAVVSDTIPANTTFVSFAAPAGWTTTTPAVGGTGLVKATKASFTINTSAMFTLVVNASEAAPNQSTISNTATIKSDTKDPNTENNSATATTTVVNPLTCFDGTTDGGFNGHCTLITGGATLDATDKDENPNNQYAGVYYPRSFLSGRAVDTINPSSVSFTYAALGETSASGGSPRLSIPIDVTGEGATDAFAFVDTLGCNDGTPDNGTLSLANANCKVSYGATVSPSWAAFANANPTWRIATDIPPFVIADQFGMWTVTNVHLAE